MFEKNTEQHWTKKVNLPWQEWLAPILDSSNSNQPLYDQYDHSKYKSGNYPASPWVELLILTPVNNNINCDHFCLQVSLVNNYYQLILLKCEA